MKFWILFRIRQSSLIRKKLNDIRIKLQNLENSRQIAEKGVKVYFSDKKEMLLSKKLFRKQRKLQNFEYQAIMKTLSIMLFAIQTGQY